MQDLVAICRANFKFLIGVSSGIFILPVRLQLAGFDSECMLCRR